MPTSERNTLPRRTVLAAAAMAPAIAAAGIACATTTAQAQESNGKVALITGSSRGIGAAAAKRLARDGYAVTVNCVKNRDLAGGVVREIEAAGGRAIWMQVDVSDAQAVRRLFDANDQAFGGVDVVVSSAGIISAARMAPG
jgi:3-oxoacyl-[acyl-carrier protein] reductase